MVQIFLKIALKTSNLLPQRNVASKLVLYAMLLHHIDFQCIALNRLV